MYRTDRVELLPATADQPVLGSSPRGVRHAPHAYNANVQNPKTLNAPLPPETSRSRRAEGRLEVYTRDPQVGLFRVWRDGVGAGLDRRLGDLEPLLVDARRSCRPAAEQAATWRRS